MSTLLLLGRAEPARGSHLVTDPENFRNDAPDHGLVAFGRRAIHAQGPTRDLGDVLPKQSGQMDQPAYQWLIQGKD